MQPTDIDFSTQLGVAILLAAADEPLPPESLTAGELAIWESLGSATAKHNWLLGRAALKVLVREDTSAMRFPHPSVSLTHAGSKAVAVRSTAKLAGIGVDFEPWRAQVHPRMAKFFLRRGEQAAAASPTDLVRLWTIKEALFKALPDNEGCTLLGFELAHPRSAAGTASGPDGRTLHYASADAGAGSLTVAVTPMRGNHVPI